MRGADIQAGGRQAEYIIRESTHNVSNIHLAVRPCLANRLDNCSLAKCEEHRKANRSIGIAVVVTIKTMTTKNNDNNSGMNGKVYRALPRT